MNIFIITIIIIIGVFLGSAWNIEVKENVNVTQATSSVLNAEDTYFDFGVISMRNGVVSHAFKIKNEETETILIKQVYTSCMCTTASIIDISGKKLGTFSMPGHGSSIANITVPAGESITVEAIFDPNAHGPSGVGLAERVIYLETDSQISPAIELRFSALVTR
ncbi:MAG: DUF1573 domain-containing protein [Parcubacteria group bacterium]|nr:DUF1573 domain-containing protein [Parcubacteria group bacterium]